MVVLDRGSISIMAMCEFYDLYTICIMSGWEGVSGV